MTDPNAIVAMKLLIGLVGVCFFYALACIAVKCIERYELMKRQQAFRAEEKVDDIW